MITLRPMPGLIDNIRRAVARNEYLISQHAVERIGLRQVREEEVIQTILHGEVIEQYPNNRPHPKCLFVRLASSGEPLYVSCAYDGQRARIITVHWFDSERWLDWRTRRKR